MRGVLAMAVLAAGLVGCAATAATSWGKPGVSMAEYLADASNCMTAAADVRAGPQVLVQDGGRGIAGAGVAPGSSEAAAASQDALMDRVNRQRDAEVRADREARQRAHDECLAGRGYVQFRLTPEQNAQLNSLPEGSRERREFLYGLGADPEVLAKQKM